MRKHILYGSGASAALLIVYIGILTLAESFSHAVQQFGLLWYLMVPLVIGFGIQIGLYFYIREGFKLMAASATGSAAASGGVSAGSMILCCLHHVTDVLPIIGLSAASLFLSQYQEFFLVLGIFSSIIGILLMLNIMQKHGLHKKEGMFSGIFRYNMFYARNIAVFASLAILTAIFMFTTFPLHAATVSLASDINSDSTTTELKDLPMVLNSENGVSIDVTPLKFEFGKDVVFNIGLNTHQGSLDFDVAEIAMLRDSNGNVYSPLRWEGSLPGGHHRSGKLIFSPIQKTDYMELTLKDIYGIKERIFRWDF